MHKTANVLNKVALSVQANMKTDLREIYGARTRAAAEAAIDVFADKYGAKYEKAVACLTKDREALLAFFDFPAEHWDHLHTSDGMDKQFLYDEQSSWKPPANPFFCSTAPQAFFCPDRHLAAAAHRACQGWPHFRGHQGRGLDWPEHGGMLDRIGTGKTPMPWRPSSRSMLR